MMDCFAKPGAAAVPIAAVAAIEVVRAGGVHRRTHGGVRVGNYHCVAIPTDCNGVTKGCALAYRRPGESGEKSAIQ